MYIQYNNKKESAMRIKYNVIFMFLLLCNLIKADGEGAGNYEYIFFTRDVPSSISTVYIRATNGNIPRWDEYKNVTTGSHSVTLAVPRNYLSCYPIFALEQGYNEYPRIGYVKYHIEVTNESKTANFYLEVQGSQFLGDIYITYDWDDDRFFKDGSCQEHGSIAITNGSTIITHNSDGEGNLCFQPTTPTNLSGSSYNNHPKLSWDASFPSFTQVRYKVERKLNSGSWTVIATDILTTTYTDNNVILPVGCGDVYYYRIKAYVPPTQCATNGKESPGYSSILEFPGTYIPDAPQYLNISGSYHAYLTWYHSGQPAGEMFKVWRKRGVYPWTMIASGLTTTSYTDTDINTNSFKGSMFGYKVNAYNPCGNSGYSNDEWVWGTTDGGGPIPKTIADFNENDYLPENYSAQAYPNPFNPSTKILYGLPDPSYVKLIIYDVVGREIINLVNYHQEAGIKEIQWSGKNAVGRQVPSGMYIIQMTAKSMEEGELFTKAQKIVLMK